MSYRFSVHFNTPATTEIYTLSLHDALPIYARRKDGDHRFPDRRAAVGYGHPVAPLGPGMALFARRGHAAPDVRPHRGERDDADDRGARHGESALAPGPPLRPRAQGFRDGGRVLPLRAPAAVGRH